MPQLLDTGQKIKVFSPQFGTYVHIIYCSNVNTGTRFCFLAVFVVVYPDVGLLVLGSLDLIAVFNS